MSPGLSVSEMIGLLQVAALLAGLVFAGLEVRQINRSRLDQQAIEAARSMQTEQWMRSALVVVNNLHPQIGAEGVDRLTEEARTAVLVVAMTCETMGYMVFRRVVPLAMVDDLYGGVVRVAWRRLGPWVERDRERSGNAGSFEWFQWLAERLLESKRPSEPAHVAHRGWRA